MFVAADRLPVFVAADQSPVFVAADQSPVFVAADRLPVFDVLSSLQLILFLIQSTARLIISGSLISVSIVIFAEAIFVSSPSFNVSPYILTIAKRLLDGG